MNEAQTVPLTVLERLIPGQTHAETSAMIGRGSLVFLGGMALAAVSFVVEQTIIQKLKRS